MSTENYPQTDGQTERMNRTLEDMLRAYVNYEQDDWDQHLTATEIAISNSQQTSTKFSPYYVNYGRHPVLPNSVTVNRMKADQVKNPTASEIAQHIQTAMQIATKNLEQARQRQTHYANQKRVETNYKVGESEYI